MLLAHLSPTQLLALAAVAVLPLLYALVRRRRRGNGLPLPPGPPREPVLGHLRVVPSDHPEYAYRQWGQDYDTDILHFSVLGRSIVVLNSIEAARELMDRRGANFADRPRFVLFEVMGWGVTLTFLRWSPRFKLHRKMLQQSFSPTACRAYRPVQTQEAARAVRAIARDPARWELRLRQFSQAVVLRIGFGIDVLEQDDPYVKMAIDVEEATGEGGVPGASLVDFFPVLRHLPTLAARTSRLLQPLAHARRTKPTIQSLHDAPWAAVEPALRAGKSAADAQASFVHTHFGRYLANETVGRPNDATIEDIKGAAGAISIAGGNTTWSTLMVCVLNLVRHPAVQRRAWDDMVALIGLDARGDLRRLPTFDDRPRLPWIECIIHETTRWYPLSPLGVPHATIAEDSYKGFRIPAGSVVYANAYAMARDPRHYADADSFDPARYLPVDQGGRAEPLPDGPFGFGRRVCPGQHLALAGAYMLVATVLATHELKCPVDQDGRELRPEVAFTNGLSNVPESFGCVFQPRSARALELLENV